MKKYLQPFINTVTLLVTIYVNYLSSTGFFRPETIGDISNQYPTLITPAGYAFSIWGFIYLMLFGFVINQWVLAKDDRIKECDTGPWFAISNIANATWTYVWLMEYTGLSVLVMTVLLISLIALTIKLKLEIWDGPLRVITWVWWPICFYTGWIVLACVVNVSAFLVKLEWGGFGLSNQVWSVVMLSVAATVYLFLVLARNMREAALVGVWGISAIAVKQFDQEPVVAYTAIVISVFLFVVAMVHAYKNRDTSPITKLIERSAGIKK